MGSDFRTDMTVKDATVHVAFHGNAESDNFEQLEAFVLELDAAAVKGNATRVVADLRELVFATSSCLKVFAGWLIGLEQRPAPYVVEFISSPQHSWQRRSLQALSACAPSVVQVSTS